MLKIFDDSKRNSSTSSDPSKRDQEIVESSRAIYSILAESYNHWLLVIPN